MLLEMIEEVLEEQSKIPTVLQNEVNQKLLDFVKYDEKKKAHIFKLPKGNPNRQEAALRINEQLVKDYPDAPKKEYLSSGKSKDVIGLTIYNGRKIAFRYAIKSGAQVNVSEVMESVIAVATGGIVERTEEFNKAFPQGPKQEIYNASILNIKKSVEDTGKALPGGGLTKQGNGVLSKAYKNFGVIRKVPKTDLIDKMKKFRYSVKREGGTQFISAQGPESAAIWNAAALKTIGKENVDSDVKKAIRDTVTQTIAGVFIYEEWAQLIDNKDRNEKAKVYQLLKENIFKIVIAKLGLKSEQFRTNFIYEGLTGEGKFVEGNPAVANYTLTWNDQGGPFSVKTIDKFMKEGEFRLRVSDRGGTRGGSIRGDIFEPKQINEGIMSTLKALALAYGISLGGLSTGTTTGDAASPDPSDVPVQVRSDATADADDEQVQTQYGKIMEQIAEKIADKFVEVYVSMGLTKFLDALINDEQGGEINMRPLYDAVGMKPEYTDFEPEPELEGT
tara:strand:+ start:50 stop:1558 length:1509 start_codon:yes stop_codon:yes gene_type:complete